MNARPALALLLMLPLVGCGGTSYSPAHSPRVSLVSDGYMRDGVKYPSGVGGGLVEAVAGNARAESEARTGRSLTIGGFVCGFTAMISEGAGAGLLVSGLERDSSGRLQSSTRSNVGLGLLLGGIVLSSVSIALLTNAEGHQLDAINIYNDGVDAHVGARDSAPPALTPSVTAPR